MNTALMALAVIIAGFSIREWFVDNRSKDGTAHKVVSRLLVTGVVVYLAVSYGNSWYGDVGDQTSYANLMQRIAFVCFCIAVVASSVTVVRRARWWLDNRHHGT
ncbi:MAG TPA: hypothetical protein VFY97_00320 [Rhodanobacteraceae bacterium]|nr:hypothetical protein [Rhodanobacteraceae bacterium]